MSNWNELSTAQLDAIFKEKGDLIESLSRDNDRLRRDNERLRAALEPFARMADSFDNYKGDDWETKDTAFGFTIGDFRSARSARANEQEG